PGKLADLPQTTEINILVSLMSQPEIPLGRHDLRNRQILADKGTGDNRNQCPEQDIHTQFLIRRVLAAIDQRRKKQTGTKETGRNPEQRTLDMPGPYQRIREPLRDINTVELLPFNRVMRGKTTDED